MGGIVSGNQANETAEQREERDEIEVLSARIERDTIRKLTHYPFYYMDSVHLDKMDIKYINNSWNQITQSTSPAYATYKKLPENAKACPLWFSDVFFERFFDVLPHCRQQFTLTNMAQHGLAIVNMITLSLKNIDLLEKHGGAEKWNSFMRKLAIDHAKRGVVHIQYGMFGETLFWTLGKCLGSEFNSTPWIKMYSLMLKSIIPVAVAEEHEKHSIRISIL